MPEATGVLILGEGLAGHLTSTTAEMLTAGHQLAAAMDEPLGCGLVGYQLEAAAEEAMHCGADKVYTVDDPLVAEYQVELYLAALTHICRTAAPRVLLMARTQSGRDLAPRLAARLGVALAQDCLEVTVDIPSKTLLATRPVYGGNAMAKVRSTGTPQFATVRPKVYPPAVADPQRRGEVIAVPVALDPAMVKTRVLEVVKEETAGVRLEDAKIVVAGGRGLGGPEGFQPLEQLAKALGAGIGASRAAVDSGWVPYSWQIGLTGKTITPDLYITVGISGASQHIAGCSGAKCIVAINKDRDANIFRYARYGIVGDWQKILGALIEAAHEFRQSADTP
ncbi:MAG TPA: electron transfer flavoprotein subunit alpha/FixB family protein [Alphaproteobacteria bacterium]|nr:electron transfer flavoprotein subunit alpha/FixB family protein [Alphaproteobacteria bacterium]